MNLEPQISTKSIRMEQHNYTLLLNYCLKKHMIGLSRKEKDRLREKFEFLEAGIWDSGVRVKKLKGLSGKVIFEARLSKGERIIFTLGKHDGRTAIYVWGLVNHDSVQKTAGKIFPENAPFLNFEPGHTEEFPEMSMDELPEEYFSQEAIDEKSQDDYGPQKWLVLNDEEWKRMLLAADADNFEIFLFLTPEQGRVLETHPPLLLSGTAGSGKTTISVYYLLRRNFLDKKRLFLTYSPYLNEFSKKIYTGLVSKTGLEDAENSPDFYVFRDLLHDLARGFGVSYDKGKEVGLREFEAIFRNHRLHQKYDAELVWEEIRSIIKGAKPIIEVERIKTLSQAYLHENIRPDDLEELKNYLYGLKCFEFMDKIDRIIERTPRYSQLGDFVRTMNVENGPPADNHRAILGEIMKVMDKRAKTFTTPLFTYQEYVNLGRKRAPNFLYERKDIYDIAEYYQARLAEQGKWDEIDLCRQAIRHMARKRGTKFSYDLVVCDEVQDFAEIQLSLIFGLAKSHKGIVLSGDPKQIINPSGFRWEEVKNKFYERGVEIPDVYPLSLNFRCVGSIVKLSNALLDLKRQLVGLSGSELREEWKFNGRPPFHLTGMTEENILGSLHLKGAGQIILVRDVHEQRRLKKALGTELIFTISEAKGLEFDTVLLWKFSSDRKSSDIWRRIRDGLHLNRSHYPHVKHEINLLYVAITRARNTLIIFDSPGHVWHLPLIHGLLYRTGEKEVLSEVWQRISTPEEWEKQGDYFFQREYYPAAAECYKNAGNLRLSEIAGAFVLEQKGQFNAAAALFKKHDYARKAAECYENAGLFGNALPLWEKLRDPDRIQTCRISLYEQDREYDKAAEAWYKLGQIEKALEDWRKANNHKKIAGHFFSVRNYGKAAEAFELAGIYNQAGACYKRLKRPDKAADLFYRSGDWTQAIPLYKKLKNTQQLVSCYVKSKDYYNAGLIFEKEKNVDEAIGLFTDFAKLSPENRMMLLGEAERSLTKGHKLKSAIRFSALGMHEQAAPVFFEKRYYDLALTGFKKIEDHEKTAECYLRQRDYYQAAVEYEKSDCMDKWERATRLFERYLESNDDYPAKQVAQLHKEADRFRNDGSYDAALARYKALDIPEKIYDIYFHLDRDDEALNLFMNRKLYHYASEYLEKKKDITVSYDLVNRAVSTVLEGRRWHWDPDRYEDFIARLLSVLIRNDSSQENLDLADRYLDWISYGLLFRDKFQESLLALMLEVRPYNLIFELFRSGQPKSRSIPANLKSFIVAVKREADKGEDPNLLACYYFLKDKPQYEEAIEKLHLNRRNYKLFGASSRHYPKAVQYLVEQNAIEDAVRVCREHRDYVLGGKTYEDAGMNIFAARTYRDGMLYEDAIRCFSKEGDRPGVARVYEKMNELDKALAIWNGLGKTKEVARVLKKKGKEMANPAQLNLF